MEQDRAAIVHALRVSEQILSLVHEHTERIEQLRPGARHCLDLGQVLASQRFGSRNPAATRTARQKVEG